MAYLRVVREGRGMSQDDVARIAGVKLKQVSRWETGEAEPTATSLAAWIAAVRANANQVTRLFIDPDATPDDARQLASEWLSQDGLDEIDRRVANLSDEEREIALRVLSSILKRD